MALKFVIAGSPFRVRVTFTIAAAPARSPVRNRPSAINRSFSAFVKKGVLPFRAVPSPEMFQEWKRTKS